LFRLEEELVGITWWEERENEDVKCREIEGDHSLDERLRKF
jgi:hypothetical protein